MKKMGKIVMLLTALLFNALTGVVCFGIGILSGGRSCGNECGGSLYGNGPAKYFNTP